MRNLRPGRPRAALTRKSDRELRPPKKVVFFKHGVSNLNDVCFFAAKSHVEVRVVTEGATISSFLVDPPAHLGGA